MKYPKRSQYKYAKSPYRIRNWPEYEAGLRRRGDLTIWFSDDAINSWRAPTSGRHGGQRIYANFAIEAALMIRMVFQLPLKQPKASCDRCQTSRSPFPITRLCRGGSGRSVRFRLVRWRVIDLSTCSSTVQVSGFTSAICGSHRRKGIGGSCTLRWTRTLARSLPRI